MPKIFTDQISSQKLVDFFPFCLQPIPGNTADFFPKIDVWPGGAFKDVF